MMQQKRQGSMINAQTRQSRNQTMNSTPTATDKLWFQGESMTKLKARIKVDRDFLNNSAEMPRIKMPSLKNTNLKTQSTLRGKSLSIDATQYSKKQFRIIEPEIANIFISQNVDSVNHIQPQKNIISGSSSRNRLEDLSQNITNEIEDQRLLMPSDRNFYFVNKSDVSNHQTFKLNLIKPFERSKVKMYLSTSRNSDNQTQQVMEKFKNKFLSPIAKSSQLQNNQNKKVIDVNRDLIEKYHQNQRITTWKKQAKHLRPLYQRPDQIKDLIQNEQNHISQYEVLNLSRNMDNSSFNTGYNFNPNNSFGNSTDNQIGYYKTLGNINEQLIKKKRLKSLIDKKNNSLGEGNQIESQDAQLKKKVEAGLLKMTQDLEKSLNDQEEFIFKKVDKLKNPQQIDSQLFDKIKTIKHYQGFTQPNFRPLNMGDKLVIFGLLDKDDSEDLAKIKEIIKQRQAQQLQDKISGGFMRLLLDKGNPVKGVSSLRAETSNNNPKSDGNTNSGPQSPQIKINILKMFGKQQQPIAVVDQKIEMFKVNSAGQQ
ncbi:UNKNOWN [Stylonychia lemnae]|uniref:Uncharacterized protein n=1 Tax=Stylonychia lemnae TaxID=5949 RepID=A0A078ABP4_STYLE|nr:UNKNOWN [Stylonychia lemnae]|eukprot:CDW79291.1 UNKNOWN [Stylonychia lemnae]